jgi:anti-sigma regulatory factor (Ser/Thr protein kinase)
MMEKMKGKRVRQFILDQVGDHPRDIARLTEREFNISRQAVNRHILRIVSEGLMIAEGSNRRRIYKLKPIAEKQFAIPLSEGLREDVLWRRDIRPLLDDIPKNILDICHYGFTEIVNNVIDHSAATSLLIKLIITAINIEMTVFDNGIGIFKKIQTEFGLDDRRHAILELAKGKLTTDPAHHTGEGIFFSSRSFDKFAIYSGGVGFHHIESGHDWLVGEEEEGTEGTLVKMKINFDSLRTLKEVFDKYSSSDDEYGFTKTIVPVSLVKYGDENLISRSQAKRLLARFEKFREVVLDFAGVETIGQAFADEIFRVFQQKNPHIHIMFINANEEVKKNIARVYQSGNTLLMAIESPATK